MVLHLGHSLAICVSHDGRILVQKLLDIFKLYSFLPHIPNPDDKPDCLSVVVGSLFAGTEAQARLQSTRRLTPSGDTFLLLFVGWRWVRPYLQFQLPCGELAERRVKLDSACRGVAKHRLVLQADFS